jgi:biopolymer transport protein ExbD
MSMQTEIPSEEMMSEINMTPFVDVMLVLLIIFIVTLPLVHQTVNIELPKVTSQKLIDPPKSIKISINQVGLYLMYEEEIDLEILKSKLALESQHDSKPTVLLYADKNARYDSIAKVLASIHQAGMVKIGFITQVSEHE